MGEAVAAKVSLGKQQLLSGNNVWTGSSNNFQNNVSIGGNVSVGGSTALGSLSVLRAATFSDNVTVNGDLTVNGTTTALATTTLEVDDNFIHLSKGASDGPYDKDSGFYFERGQGSSATAIVWDESEDRFVIGALGSLGDTLEVTLNGKKRDDDTDTSAFVATFTLSGQLADDVNNIQITGVSGGPTATDYNGAVSPWTFSAGVLTYTFDSDDSSDGGITYPQPSFIQFREDVKKLGYDATNGYYVLASADSTIFDVNFADSNYLDYDFTTNYSLSSTPVETLATSPDADTATVTPGSLRVGSVTITDQTDGEVSLGDLTDFEAGLAS